MGKELIINADDFGYTAGVNAGICEGYDDGVVSSVSVMAGGPAFDDAVDRLAERPNLGRGVHVALTTMRPLTDPAAVPSLLEGGDRFRASGFQFVLAYFRGDIDIADVEREARAQIERVLDSVDGVDHLDSHMHLHMLPGLFALFCDLAAEYDIPAVRVSDEGLPFSRHALTSGYLGDAVGTPDIAKKLLLSTFARYNGPTDRSPTRAFRGVLNMGGLSPSRLHRLLRVAERFPLEVAVHPGYVDETLRRSPETLLGGRETDLAGVTDDAVVSLVEQEFDLVRFADLV